MFANSATYVQQFRWVSELEGEIRCICGSWRKGLVGSLGSGAATANVTAIESGGALGSSRGVKGQGSQVSGIHEPHQVSAGTWGWELGMDSHAAHSVLGSLSWPPQPSTEGH